MGDLRLAIRNLWEACPAGRSLSAGKNRNTGSVPGLQPEQEQMEQYAEAFYSLAKLFQRLPCQKERLGDEELDVMFEAVKEQACRDCPAAKRCWDGECRQTCELLYEALQELERSGEISGRVQKRLENSCGRPGEVADALQESYAEALNRLLWSNRMLEQRRAAGEQIYQTAQLLRRTARGFSGAPEQELRIRKRLRRELRYLDTELEGIRVFCSEEKRMEVYLTLRTVRRAFIPAGAAAEALSDCCGEKMRPAWNCHAAVSDVPKLFHFVPDTRYQMFCGIARITKAGELVSGDNYALLQKDTGKVVMSLADGMGSGVQACRESEKVIELLEQFLQAGFPQETAVRMINSCMLLQNSSQMFSTIDLCMVDLYNAKCDMIKSGAASTFLCCGPETEVIRPRGFPAGVLQQSDYECMHRRLKSGSGIVMMTDGVLEALPEENREQAMAELIAKTESRNAQEHAKRLMERVYLMQDMQARDDMTIMVGKVWSKFN